MASRNQKQLLLGLEFGRPLADLLREPGMPSKKMLDEWRADPMFEELYQAALAKGGVSTAEPVRLVMPLQLTPHTTSAAEVAPEPEVLPVAPVPAPAQPAPAKQARPSAKANREKLWLVSLAEQQVAFYQHELSIAQAALDDARAHLHD